jgi:hypothetical protein
MQKRSAHDHRNSYQGFYFYGLSALNQAHSSASKATRSGADHSAPTADGDLEDQAVTFPSPLLYGVGGNRGRHQLANYMGRRAKHL